MSDSNNDNWESAVERLVDSSNKLRSLLGENWIDKIFTIKGDNNEVWEQYHIWKQSFIDIRTCMRPTTIIQGTENEEGAELWRGIGNKDSYPLLEYLKQTRDCWEIITDDEDFEEMLTDLIKFPFFKPDHWLKKEDELPPLYIKGAGIPTWLLDRYREAVYSYVYGFNNAAVAMCRSIVEGIIDNRLGDKCNKNVDLKEKIDFFMKTVKDTEHKQVVWSTNSVRLLANAVLHNIKTSCKESKVKEALLKTRDFISIVY